MELKPAHIILVVSLLGAFAAMNFSKSEKPWEELKEFAQGLVVIGLIVLVGATVVRVGWKMLTWAWS